jgi:hypothetical protein
VIPAFFGLGAQKCASTWIYDIMKDHPRVFVPEVKELDFFSCHYDNGYPWYERHFRLAAEGAVAGEVSPSYFHHPAAPARLFAYNPAARLIVSLRDPVERAMSQHRHLIRLGYHEGPDLSFEAALPSNPSYIEQGCYATHLGNWLKVFPRAQMLIVLMDDIHADAEGVARSLYRFLGLDEGHRSAALGKRSNPSYVIRSRLLDLAVIRARQLAAKAGLKPLWTALAQSGVGRRYRQVNRPDSRMAVPPLRPETERALRARFAPEVAALEEILGRSLPQWRGEGG